MTQHFWLICGLWCGVGNALFMWSRLRKHVALGEFQSGEVTSFLTGMALWIFTPCVLLWALQLSVGPQARAVFLDWPSPQRYAACALQVFVWAALLRWVFFKGGANTLSAYHGAGRRSAAFLYSPAMIKLGTVAMVVGGSVALLGRQF